jgi:hypothetical protein
VKQFPVPVDAYTEPVAKLVLTLETGSSPTSALLGPTIMIGS